MDDKNKWTSPPCGHRLAKEWKNCCSVGACGCLPHSPHVASRHLVGQHLAGTRLDGFVELSAGKGGLDSTPRPNSTLRCAGTRLDIKKNGTEIFLQKFQKIQKNYPFSGKKFGT